jgi:hypothetical protein
MRDATKSLSTILAAGEAVSETELRERLSALISEATQARAWSLQQRGEYDLICKSLDKIGGRNV